MWDNKLHVNKMYSKLNYIYGKHTIFTKTTSDIVLISNLIPVVQFIKKIFEFCKSKLVMLIRTSTIYQENIWTLQK